VTCEDVGAPAWLQPPGAWLDLDERPNVVNRTCARCGVPIAHRDRRSRHCSALCRDRDRVGSPVGFERLCLHCGVAFKPTKAPHVYCGKTCRDRADLERNRSDYNRRNAERRARQRGAEVGESFTRQQIFERDFWICQLCLAPIDGALSGRKPLAPALDHIVPLNKGGTHSWDNVQASHFACNARKQDRTDVLLLAPPGKEKSHGRSWAITEGPEEASTNKL
jgi:5-methylcytosine-specific restriction endonuclease McrA